MKNIILLTAAIVAAASSAQLPQPPTMIRSRISAVPVDVRVVDRNGNPVTDLKKEDFAVTEDGDPQEISHFAVQVLTPDPAASGGVPSLTVPSGNVAAQNRRVFLLLLGRGRMGSGSSKELDALVSFIRGKLLPQDAVALIAYNRATDFTTDHEAVVRIVDRYRTGHLKIETDLFEHFAGLHAAYGALTIPPSIQKQVDELFAQADALRPRELVPGQLSDRSRIRADIRRTTEDLLRSEAIAGREPGTAITDPANARTVERLGVTLDEHLRRSVVTNHDISNIYAGIEYMRFIEGEKHMVVITPEGLDLPRMENERSIAAAAADSRIAVHIVYTGGLAGAPAPTSRASSPLPSFATTSRQLFNVEGMRLISDLTGGHTTAYRYGEVAMNRLDAATRSQYLIGYYPKNTVFDGSYRKVRVEVKRKNVDVMYRRGYFAQDRLVPLDKREFMSFTRVMAAGAYADKIEDLQLSLKPFGVVGSGNSREISVEIVIRPERVAFRDELGLKVAALDIALFALTKGGDPVGEAWKTIDLRLTPEAHQRFLKEGASFQVTIALRNYPKQVKGVLYNFTSDLLGSATAMVY